MLRRTQGFLALQLSLMFAHCVIIISVLSADLVRILQNYKFEYFLPQNSQLCASYIYFPTIKCELKTRLFFLKKWYFCNVKIYHCLYNACQHYRSTQYTVVRVAAWILWENRLAIGTFLSDLIFKWNCCKNNFFFLVQRERVKIGTLHRNLFSRTSWKMEIP